MKQKFWGLFGLGICLVLVLFFGIEGLTQVPYIRYSFMAVLLGSVYLISTDGEIS